MSVQYTKTFVVPVAAEGSSTTYTEAIDISGVKDFFLQFYLSGSVGSATAFGTSVSDAVVAQSISFGTSTGVEDVPAEASWCQIASYGPNNPDEWFAFPFNSPPLPANKWMRFGCQTDSAQPEGVMTLVVTFKK